jgi:c-di-AMP phosphodiesterase-like protein
MPFAIIKRYLLPYLLITFMAFSIWISLVMVVDGWLPVSAFLFLVAVMLGALPVLVYLDYRDVKAMVIEVIELKKGNKAMSQAEVTQKAIGMIAEKLSIPEFLVSYFANKAIEKFELRKSIQLSKDE